MYFGLSPHQSVIGFRNTSACQPSVADYSCTCISWRINICSISLLTRNMSLVACLLGSHRLIIAICGVNTRLLMNQCLYISPETQNTLPSLNQSSQNEPLRSRTISHQQIFLRLCCRHQLEWHSIQWFEKLILLKSLSAPLTR